MTHGLLIGVLAIAVLSDVDATSVQVDVIEDIEVESVTEAEEDSREEPGPCSPPQTLEYPSADDMWVLLIGPDGRGSLVTLEDRVEILWTAPLPFRPDEVIFSREGSWIALIRDTCSAAGDIHVTAVQFLGRSGKPLASLDFERVLGGDPLEAYPQTETWVEEAFVYRGNLILERPIPDEDWAECVASEREESEPDLSLCLGSETELLTIHPGTGAVLSRARGSLLDVVLEAMEEDEDELYGYW